MSSIAIQEQALALLKKFYGYHSFRPGQAQVIHSVVSGRDSLVIMPTGGGKSLCYQIPAMIMDGCAIVVSPLIALMHDQVTALIANGIPAAAVNSNISDIENRRVMEEVFNGRIKLLYISPERLMGEIDRWSHDLRISLFAIDEAHCISQWGHDFRPVYTSLSHIKELFPDTPVIALTATADRLTRDDIARQLRLRDPFCHTGSFDRPNISLKVMPAPPMQKKISMIGQLIDRYPDDSGIVYCISRRASESIHSRLVEKGFRSVCYHAGLPADQRYRAQRDFINGDAQVVCATVAFGMGIDKSNIRWVVHNNMPANIESYYQEIGRAGRDGLPAEALLFYSFGDIATIRSFIDESGRPRVNLEKLERMKAYAESPVCRRRTLLSYFNEETDHDCGNCDVCLDPPERFDGTETAQKAMSAIIRTGSSVGAMMLIDILRGSARNGLIDKGYNLIKTYGAGRDLSYAQWNAYLSQMIQLGLVDIDYENGNKLRVTGYGQRILHGEARIELSKFNHETARIPVRKTGTAVSDPIQALFGQLKKTRKKVAEKEGIPAELVFNDATLLDMARKSPSDMDSFATVSGAGEKKTVKYWKPFVTAIRKFNGLSTSIPQGSTYRETLILHNAGIPVQEIARLKKVSGVTIYSHFAKLIEEGLITDFERIITRRQYMRVMELAMSEDRDRMYETLNAEMPKGLPRVAFAISAYLARQKNC